MYGQAGRRQAKGVRLVRMSQYDRMGYGAGRGFGTGRGRQKKGAWFLAVFLGLLAAACVGTLVCLFYMDGQESITVVENEVFSYAGEPEAVPVPVEDIGLLEETAPSVPLVVIDPGHGGEDEGCSRGDVTEDAINLELARMLAAKLREMGVDVVLTREEETTGKSLEERVQTAEEYDADIYVSIHQNACEERENSTTGIETWYYGEESRRLARLVHMGTLEKTKARDREVRQSDELYVLRETSMPACLIETGFLSNRKEREALCDPAYREKLAAGIAWGIQYYLYPKTMYLTFDDGPSEETTGKILDILKERDIKATFFVVGENVRRYPDMARRIVEEGHTIGIHCNCHVYDEIYASVDSYLEDFQAAYDAVYETTGVEVKLFRFPGGSINAYNKEVCEDIIQEMTQRGYIYFDWNGSLEDAVKKSTPEKLLQNARESTLGRKKIVMLAHDIIPNTAQCLEALIDQLPEYQMEPLTPEVEPIQF